MRAASPLASFFLRELSSAIKGIDSLFLGHVRASRLSAAYLLFTVALVMVPTADIPETLFDEANTPIDEIVVEKAAFSWEHRQAVTAFVPRIFAQLRRTCVRRTLSVYARRLTDSRTFRVLFCSLLC
jgi:hypothetical protein